MSYARVTWPVATVATTDQLAALQRECRSGYVDPSLIQYAVRVVSATRYPDRYKIADLGRYISYGASTVSQSVKLDLMAQGLATKDGARRDPEGPNLDGVTVELGVPASRSVDALMGLDDILDSKRPPALGNKFAEQMANNLSRNVGWPADLMEMHYRIARDGLLSRLKGARFL